MFLYARTFLTQSPEALLAQLSRLSKPHAEDVLLFTLSTNLKASDLSRTVTALQTISKETIGCLSAPLSGPGAEEYISCSVAVLEKSRVVPFRSEIRGRAAPQVGRWHAFRKKDATEAFGSVDLPSAKVNWEEIWSRGSSHNTLPTTLQGIRSVQRKSIVIF